jgi:hypothetical protein
MNVEDIVSRANGEFVSNKAQAVLNGEHVELAYLDGQVWILTERGQQLAAEYAESPEEAAAPKTRKKAAPAVESAEVPTEPEIVLDQPAAE